MQACAIYLTAPEEAQYKTIEMNDATKLEILFNAEKEFETQNIIAIIFGDNLQCILNEE